MLLNDREITHLCEFQAMISPFSPTQVSKDNNGNKIASYGLSSFGYDIRCAHEFEFVRKGKLTNVDGYTYNKAVVFSSEMTSEQFNDAFVKVDDGADENPRALCGVHLQPGSMMLTRSLERFRIPRNVLAICTGKSTWARMGIFVNVTPLEPEWEGYLTIEVSNIGDASVVIHGGEGIAQLIFMKGNDPITSYRDRKGKYQNQGPEVTKPR